MAKTSEKSTTPQDYAEIGAKISNRFIHAVEEAHAFAEKLKHISSDTQKSDEETNIPIIQNHVATTEDKIKDLWQQIESQSPVEDIAEMFSIDDVIAVIKYDIALRKQQSNKRTGVVTPIDFRKTVSQNLGLKSKKKSTVSFAHKIEHLISSKAGRYAEDLLRIWMSSTQNMH